MDDAFPAPKSRSTQQLAKACKQGNCPDKIHCIRLNLISGNDMGGIKLECPRAAPAASLLPGQGTMVQGGATGSHACPKAPMPIILGFGTGSLPAACCMVGGSWVGAAC
jgi:hypothetical protein